MSKEIGMNWSNTRVGIYSGCFAVWGTAVWTYLQSGQIDPVAWTYTPAPIDLRALWAGISAPLVGLGTAIMANLRGWGRK
jgi:hypothetical protein